LLREALSLRSKTVKVANKIEKGIDPDSLTEEYNITPIRESFKINFEDWWFEKLFQKIGRSSISGFLIIYFIANIPRLAVLPFVLNYEGLEFQTAYFISYLGDFTLVLSLLILKIVYDNMKRLSTYLNDVLIERFVAPVSLIKKKNILQTNKLDEIDTSYKETYINPLVGKTMQYGFDISFNKKYQIGCGLIASGLFIFILLSIYVFSWLPTSVFTIWIPIPAIAEFWTAYMFCYTALFWFVDGMIACSLFTVFLIIIQVCVRTIRIRPYEGIKEYFQPITGLILKISFLMAINVAWFSPYMLVWTSSSSEARQSATSFLIGFLFVMIPIIILSLIIPLFKMHKGQNGSRERAIYIKNQQLDQLKMNPIKDLSENLSVENHLIMDYKYIQQKSEWVLNIPQLLEIIGALFLPILVFLLGYFFPS